MTVARDSRILYLCLNAHYQEMLWHILETLVFFTFWFAGDGLASTTHKYVLFMEDHPQSYYHLVAFAIEYSSLGYGYEYDLLQIASSEL